MAICRAGIGPNKVVRRVTIRLDGTRPEVTDAIPAREPDHAGWFTSEIRFDFSGTDATSGIASCRRATYDGPDSADASIVGRCADRAGNVSRRRFGLMFDATPPSISGLTATPGVRRVALGWQTSPDVTSVEVVRSPGRGSERESVVFTGPGSSFADDQVAGGVPYLYSVKVADAAGHQTREVVAATPLVPRPDTPAGGVIPSPAPDAGDRRIGLLFPAARATVRMRRPPLLRWVRVRRARYYNVQLYRGSRKVLSAWPTRARYQLKTRWRYRGTTYRLRRGRYRWYVWPGFGARAKARYGDLLGHRTFTVVRR